MLATDIVPPPEIETAPRVDTRVPRHVRIINGALDEDPTSPAGVILLGRIDPATFRFLKIDERTYQRRQSDRADIFEALKAGKVPPTIDIGVRGEDFISDGSDFLIRSEAYIVDGGGRVGSASRLFDLVPQMGVRLFAMVHFNTTPQWESDRFDALNKNVHKVSANLHLRNLRDRNAAILTLYGLTHNEPSFPLYKRVSWLQNMQRGDLLGAQVLAKVCMRLHVQFGRISSLNSDGVAQSLMKTVSMITLQVFRQNVRAFFDLVDECWPLEAVEYRRAATQLKSTFLMELARMLSDHPCFWSEDGATLAVCADDRRKLAKFKIGDPHIANLAGAGGKARIMLYQLLVNHMNSGRREHRLVSRYAE